MSERYTEGVCGDGVMILDNGRRMTIANVLKRLNQAEEAMREARHILDCSLGDTDPPWLPPDDVLREEDPILYCCMALSRILEPQEAGNDD